MFRLYRRYASARLYYKRHLVRSTFTALSNFANLSQEEIGGKSTRYVKEVNGTLEGGYISILLVSCFMWSGALDSSALHLSKSTTSLSSPITIILISTLLIKI